MKQKVLNHIKNIQGWRTKRKIVVLSIDDFGNVRLNSRQARRNLDKLGIKAIKRFDVFDTLETKEDLEQLFEVLKSIRNINRYPIITAYSIPCNINFELMAKEGNIMNTSMSVTNF